MAVGMDEAHGAILRDGPGATTGVTTIGDVSAGATIDLVRRAGGYATIGGRTTTGGTGGAITGGDIDETAAIDLCGVLKIGIAGDRLSQSRDTIPVPQTEGVKQLSLS
jgi:hypothetical protein